MFHYIDCYTVSFAATGLWDKLHSAQRERDRGTVYARFEVMSAHAWCDRSVTDLLFTTREKRSQMCEIHFVWSCPTWPSRWGMRISIDWPRLKSCQAVCDECRRGANCSGQSRDAGCFDMWDWAESCVTKIWGLSHDHGFVLFLSLPWLSI